MALKLREYQRDSIHAAYQYFREDKGSPLIELPTGAGKSLVLAGLCHDLLTNYSKMRIVVLSHSIELVEQDYNKLREYWTKAPAGVYSASLGKKQAHHPITFATIQSVYKKAHILGHRDLICIDEAHLLSRKTDGMYNRLISALKEVNPKVRLLGLTASPFRVDSGLLYEGDGALFDGVCYSAKLMDLVNAGFLCRIVSKPMELQADLGNVRVTGGEFNAGDAEKEFDRITEAAIADALPRLAGRGSVMWFCSGIEHADHVRDLLRARGEFAESVSSETPKEERKRILEGFKAGAFRHICSMALITTGYDAPRTDGIVMLRATMSPGLYLQIAGRGLRLFIGKLFCLFLDYGGNIDRHGPLTHIAAPNRRGKGKKEKDTAAKVRICEVCRTAWPLGTMDCGECGHVMTVERDPEAALTAKAAEIPMMMTDAEYRESQTFWTEVDRVRYARHRKLGKPDSVRVEYDCGLITVKEWVCLFHGGYAERKGQKWWRDRGGGEVTDIDEALTAANFLPEPKRIRVRKDGKNYEVIDYDFKSLPETRDESSLEAVAGVR